jgi:hypothetical protein
MNRRDALKTAGRAYKGSPKVASGFAFLDGVVVVAIKGSEDTLAVYHPTDLQRLKAMCDMALSHQLDRKPKR